MDSPFAADSRFAQKKKFRIKNAKRKATKKKRVCDVSVCEKRTGFGDEPQHMRWSTPEAASIAEWRTMAHARPIEF